MSGSGAGGVDQDLVDALASSQRLGMLGGRPIGEVIEHAGAFVEALQRVSGTVIDLGSGGGVPGLVIARARPDLHLVLVDRRATRADHLARLVLRLALSDRVEVRAADARTLPGTFASAADAVVARGFGPPAETLARAAPLLAPGGLLVVSEPPWGSSDRWPTELMAGLRLHRVNGPHEQVAIFRHAERFT